MAATASMFREFKSGHASYIHDVAFDFYGTRLATCSSDHKVIIWELDGDQKWKEQSRIEDHKYPVIKVSWAHPEYGQVLASCSLEDKRFYIWEEQGELAGRTWKKKSPMSGSTEPIVYVEFAPCHQGFRLATASTDGKIRIYECSNVFNLGDWSLQSEFEIEAVKAGKGRQPNKGKAIMPKLSWCTSRYDHPMLVVGSDLVEADKETEAEVWQYNPANSKWTFAHRLNMGSDAFVRDVSWCPDIGRSFHMLACATSRGCSVWKLPKDQKIPKEPKTSGQKQILQHESSEGGENVWRVEWNVAGTVVATSGEDFTVRLWKTDLSGQWRCVSQIKSESDPSKVRVVD